MPTYNQLCKKKTDKEKKLIRHQHYKGVLKKRLCTKLVVRTPKTLIQLRKLVKLRLSNAKRVYAYIPGEGLYKSIPLF
jgi:ribosomal protein S12